MGRRAWRPLALLAVVLASNGTAQADESWVAVIHERAQVHGVSGAYLERILRCESNLQPGAIGQAGEQGMAQLHSRGLRPLFFQWGYGDPFNGWEAIDFTARALATGLARHWTCAR